jgi:hypothetical protein
MKLLIAAINSLRNKAPIADEIMYNYRELQIMYAVQTEALILTDPVDHILEACNLHCYRCENLIFTNSAYFTL